MEIIKYKTPSSILPLRRDFPLLNPPPLRGGGRVGEKSPEDNEKDISKAIQIIKNGGVVICPTDTVYGLIADATNREAVEKVFEIKKRDKAKAISIFVKNIEEINKIASVNEKQYDFLKNNLPGKFTVILKRRPDSGLAENLFGEKGTVGIRVVDDKIINEILGKVNKPLTATSANISGQPASGKIKEILEQFENQEIKPDLVLDAGDLPENSPSKIIDLAGKKFKIVRN